MAEELERVLGGRTPIVADLPGLPYVERVIKESMRLYPPAWVMGREAVWECEVGGYRMPAGTPALMSQWVVHRTRATTATHSGSTRTAGPPSTRKGCRASRTSHSAGDPDSASARASR